MAAGLLECAAAHIFAAAHALRDAGFEPLPMTGNYYDDLQARFRLDTANFAQIKELGIL